MLGSETAETNLRTLLLPCYLQLLGVDVGERDCGDESADAAITMLFQLLGVDVGERDCGDESCGRCCYHAICSCWGYRCWGAETAVTNLRTLLLPCYLHLLGVDVGERDCGDESADAAVTMLFAAVGGRCWGARLRRRICGRCCNHAICSCWG